MTPAKQPRWWPIITAFTIWLVHFMVSWGAGEIWPREWPANALAWGATAVALLAIGLHVMRTRAQCANGEISGWDCRFAQGAAAIATTAVLFSALPSLVFLP